MLFTTRSAAVIAGSALAALLSTSPAVSASDALSPDCSERTLRGDYAFEIDGSLLAGPVTGLLRGLAMTRFDGEGGLTQVDFTTLNGVPMFPDWRSVTGTYEVNADCTGRAELVPPPPAPALRLRLVVSDRGRRVATIVEGNATGSRGERSAKRRRMIGPARNGPRWAEVTPRPSHRPPTRPASRRRRGCPGRPSSAARSRCPRRRAR